ncbi:glycoside hydrolase family 43 protein [Flavobacterium sp. LS1R10]|uniref:glycoside hydrolase family 43 protein n=1 Tax=Flavobacterium sp. LS1R10 TaxID=2497482 RepID=UPI000F82F969|nr:glycoside hydrolase family 43 protein [Flavobacterium sp. LS1R10]RTY76533.1 beta-xylosidase [Flavobacterium sp. LS1R10]
MKNTLTIICSLCLFICCSQEKITTETSTDINSKNIFLADPTIFYNEGTYYLYGTTTGNSSLNGEGFQVYTSSDQKNWKGPVGAQAGLALKKGDAYGTQGFWAPQILKYNNLFYMIYTANENIAIATSNNPVGPFRNTSKEPLSASVKQIDPFVFIDDDGKKYLYHVRLTNGNRIFVAELNDDLLSIKLGTLTECIAAELQWENTQNVNWPVTEGPTVLKKGSLYYLIYSANDFRNLEYAVGYATSKSPLGPWKKSTTSPIISRNLIGENGPGHGDLFLDKDNQLQYVLHTHFSATSEAPRKAAVIEMNFVEKDQELQLQAKKESFQFLKTN